MLEKCEGHIGIATLPAVVRDLCRAEASGILHLKNGGIEKSIFFRRGEIVFAATSLENERLGERLVRAGKIKRSVLELAIRVMTRSHERLGKTIVEWGWISPLEMQRWVASQIKDIIYSVFTWSSGEYRFEPKDQPLPEDLALEIHTAEVIYEGTRRISDLKAIRAGVGPPSGALRLIEGTRLGIPITHEDGFILSRVNAHTTILDIVSDSPLGEEEALRRIYALLLAGVVERAEPVPAARQETEPTVTFTSEDEKQFRDSIIVRQAAMRFGNYYDRLGLSFGASLRAIQDAYEEVLRSIAPSPSLREKVGDIEDQIGEVRRKVVEAYRVLSDPQRRRLYDRSLSGSSTESTVAATTLGARTVVAPPAKNGAEKAQKAELYYIEANRSWQTGEYFDAIAGINEALRLDPDKAHYHRVLANWLSENPSCTEAAVAHFRRAIELDPENRQTHHELAAFLEQNGEIQKARDVLRGR
ncbi:MAG TPA: DUF4388 domain-containing protein [Vicinamibacteria bacterium]|nr:DUF4388 domain-containing protein [Vicinamibacteria bacterium]